MSTGDRYVPARGTPIDLAREYRKTVDGALHHPGDHPAFGGHIRWGHLADGRPWVDSTIPEAYGEWVFDGPQGQGAADAAVAQIRATRPDDLWERTAAYPSWPPSGST